MNFMNKSFILYRKKYYTVISFPVNTFFFRQNIYSEPPLKRHFLTYLLGKLNSFTSSIYSYKISLSFTFDGRNTEVCLLSPSSHPVSSLERYIPFPHKSEFHDIEIKFLKLSTNLIRLSSLGPEQSPNSQYYSI